MEFHASYFGFACAAVYLLIIFSVGLALKVAFNRWISAASFVAIALIILALPPPLFVLTKAGYIVIDQPTHAGANFFSVYFGLSFVGTAAICYVLYFHSRRFRA